MFKAVQAFLNVVEIASQIVGIIGLVSNGLSMLIFYRQRVHKIFHNLLLTLAVFDTASVNVSVGLRPGVHLKLQ